MDDIDEVRKRAEAKHRKRARRGVLRRVHQLDDDERQLAHDILGEPDQRATYSGADPDCERCGGDGFVRVPTSLCGGHVCGCTLR